MNSLLQKLMLGGSSAAMFAAAIAVGPAMAQEAAGATEEVVVTGTSIRGVAPVGSNVITVDQEAIKISGAVNADCRWRAPGRQCQFQLSAADSSACRFGQQLHPGGGQWHALRR
jgi:hypothetical protein